MQCAAWYWIFWVFGGNDNGTPMLVVPNNPSRSRITLTYETSGNVRWMNRNSVTLGDGDFFPSSQTVGLENVGKIVDPGFSPGTGILEGENGWVGEKVWIYGSHHA